VELTVLLAPLRNAFSVKLLIFLTAQTFRTATPAKCPTAQLAK
jgi:hypothetical protein